jgi:AcrR family transcriptional regulator
MHLSMPKLTGAAMEERRQHILRAAEVCFARDGFHRTTIADICKEADVSTGAVYVYFRDKESIIRAILKNAQQTRLASLGHPDAPEQRMQVLLGWVSQVLTPTGLHTARIDLNLWAEAVRSPRVGTIAREALRDATQSVADLVVRRLHDQKALRGRDPDAIAAVLVSLFLGLEVLAGVGVPLNLDEILRVLVEVFWTPEVRGKAPRKKRKGKSGPA